MFSGINSCFKKTEEIIKEDLTLFRQSLKHYNLDTQISLLLQKIVNGKFDSAFIFQLETKAKFNIIDYFGKFNHSIAALHITKNIPILINGTVNFILCIRAKLKKSIEISDELIELLKDVLKEI